MSTHHKPTHLSSSSSYLSSSSSLVPKSQQANSNHVNNSNYAENNIILAKSKKSNAQQHQLNKQLLADDFNKKMHANNYSYINNNSNMTMMTSPITTTEEEFKKMETAVASLLVSKSQIEQLKNEKNSLVKIYEARLNEQNEQIDYLQMENEQLKLLINSLKLEMNNKSKQTNESFLNANSSLTTSFTTTTTTECNCNVDYNNWKMKYQQCLDNIIMQLLNALKIQESICIEYSKFEKFKHLSNQNTNNNGRDEHASNSFCTSNSWTFNDAKFTNSITTNNHNNYSSNNFGLSSSQSSNSEYKNIFNKFQHLLIQQQRQQINILNDLTQISKSLRVKDTVANSNITFDTQNDDILDKKTKNQKFSISPPPTPVHKPKQNLLKNSQNTSLPNSHEAILTSSSCKSETVTDKKSSNIRNVNNNNNNSKKPSKIPKFNTTTEPIKKTNVAKTNAKRGNTTQEVNNRSRSTATAKNTNSSRKSLNSSKNQPKNVSSKIPLPRQQQQSHKCRESNKELNAVDQQQQNHQLNYNTYVKNKNKIKNQKVETDTSARTLVNSATFDKNETIKLAEPKKQETTKEQVNKNTSQSEVSNLIITKPLNQQSQQLILSECKEAKIFINKNLADILLVPVVKINTNISNKLTRDDEGYSTMSNELVNQIKVNDKVDCLRQTSTIVNGYKMKKNDDDDSGIRMSRDTHNSSNITVDDECTSQLMTASTTNATNSTPSSSLNHSPLLANTSVSKMNERRDNAVLTNSSNNFKSINRKIKKRYCFPTLKSFSYYYNNRYYHQYHKKSSSQEDLQNNDSDDYNLCCKYLSDTDISSLVNQLSSYDKDLSYNVYHLDTLYNNVDYILFNSYASDTELVYNYNRRHGRNQHFLNSNYKLYINDYFNQPYDEEDLNSSANEMSVDEDAQHQQQHGDKNEENMQQEQEIEIALQIYDDYDDYEEEEDDEEENEEFNDKLADYELAKYEFEMEDDDNHDDYCFNDCKNYDYIDYGDNSQMMIELTVDENLNHFEYEYYDNQNEDEYINNDELVYDDDDELILMMKHNQMAQKQAQKANKQQYGLNITNAMFMGNIMDSPIFSSDSILSINSSDSNSSSTSSSCSCDCSTSDSSDLSADSINQFKKPTSKDKKKCSHQHRHKKHEYFIEKIDNYSQRFDKENLDDDHFESFDVDEFVRQLNRQCSLDKTIQLSNNSHKRLKELNMLAIKAVALSSQNEQTGKPNECVKVAKPLVRRHTITTMPLNSACLINQSQDQNQANEQTNLNQDRFIQRHDHPSPLKFNDTKNYVGSFNNHTLKKNKIITSNTENNFMHSFYNVESGSEASSGKSNTINFTFKTKPNNDHPSSPIKLNTDKFNQDFYRLCSDTFFNNGSDLNLNYSSSSLSKAPQNNKRTKQESNDEDVTNLTSHVNTCSTLFDQWLGQKSNKD